MTPWPSIAEAFAARLSRWAVALGLADEAVALLAATARAVVERTEDGHVAVPLAEVAASLGRPLEDVRAALLGTAVVATPDARAQALFVLDPADRVYLHRHYDYEERLARRLALALNAPPLAVPAASLATLAARFGPASAVTPDWPRLAAALALNGRLTVISGGPGTGKTTAVAKLLACLLAGDPNCRIALAAPTGKAASRLGRSIEDQMSAWPEELRRLLKPTTVHRLLGHGPDGYRHDRERRLPVDVVVIDETSMLDLSLATHLLEAVPDGARIVLLGDRDQLEAVDSGAVFAQLSHDHSITAAGRARLAATAGVPETTVDAPLHEADPMADAVVWFTVNHRFGLDTPIGRLALGIRSGDVDAVKRVLAEPASGLEWVVPPALPTPPLLERLRAGYADYVAAAAQPAADPRAVLAAFDAYRVLSATRAGPYGVEALNRHLAAPMRAAVGDADASGWYVGRPVLITRNDATVGLYNGEVGIALRHGERGLRVWFASGDRGVTAYTPSQLPPHETAFAMTVHKSQGSEFRSVAVVLPQAQSPLLTRELLYTGVTRAVREVLLIAPEAVLATSVTRRSGRESGLRDRLAEARWPRGPDR